MVYCSIVKQSCDNIEGSNEGMYVGHVICKRVYLIDAW